MANRPYPEPDYPEHFEWTYIGFGDPYDITVDNRRVLTLPRERENEEYLPFIATCATIEARTRVAWKHEGRLDNVPKLSVLHQVDFCSHVMSDGEEAKVRAALNQAGWSGLATSDYYDSWRRRQPRRGDLQAAWQREARRVDYEHYRIDAHEHVRIVSFQDERRIMQEITARGPVIGCEIKDSSTSRSNKYITSIVGFYHDVDGELCWVVQDTSDVGRHGIRAVSSGDMEAVWIPWI